MKYLKPLTLFEESVKKCSVLFGLSVCDKYVDMAISTEFKAAASPYLFLPRDEYLLDTLVNGFEAYMSKDPRFPGYIFDLDGIIVGKNHVGLINEMCKTGKLKDLKYTYWEDNIASKRAEHKLKVHMDIFPPPPTDDMFSSIFMLQGYLDFCNTLLHQSDPLLCSRQLVDPEDQEDSK